jgi:hypothetical protein
LRIGFLPRIRHTLLETWRGSPHGRTATTDNYPLRKEHQKGTHRSKQTQKDEQQPGQQPTTPPVAPATPLELSDEELGPH